MLTKIECPKDKQRLFDMYIKQNNSVSLEPLSKLINEIEIKCPKCGGIVSIDLRSAKYPSKKVLLLGSLEVNCGYKSFLGQKKM